MIRRLDAFKEQVPAVEVVLEGYSGRFPREMDLAVAWNRIVAGSMLVFFCWQQATGVEAFSGWKLRRGGWRWALVGTGTILASGVCAYAALNVAILLSCSGVHTGTLVNNTVMVRATVTQAASALDRWAAENGYMGGSRCRWSLQTVPKGQLVARVEVSDVALPFDRWRMRSSDWELPEPDLAIQIVGSEKPVQSEVSIRSSNSVEVGSEKQKRWQGIVDSLSDAVSKAAEIDPTKPVEMPALKQTDMGSEWAGLCGVLAATLLWLCVRARRLKSAPSSFSCSGVRWSMKSPSPCRRDHDRLTGGGQPRCLVSAPVGRGRCPAALYRARRCRGEASVAWLSSLAYARRCVEDGRVFRQRGQAAKEAGGGVAPAGLLSSLAGSGIPGGGSVVAISVFRDLL